MLVISLVSFGLFGPALSTTNINIVKWRYFVIFSPVFFCSLNWEFSYSNWEINILFGIGNTTEYRSSKRAKKNPVLYNHGSIYIYIYAYKCLCQCVGKYTTQMSTMFSLICLGPSFQKVTHHVLLHGSLLGLAPLIEISVNRSIYKRKTIIDMKIQKSVTFNGYYVYLFN